MRQGQDNTPTLHQYLISLPTGSVVGVDPHVHSANQLINLRKDLNTRNITLKSLLVNPIDAVWGASRPASPQSPMWLHPMEHAGRTVADKLASLRLEMAKQGVGLFLTAALDEVAWLFNIRGGDVECNPVTMAYAIITAGDW
jgi:Xaa-Pro aminopeptidase